MSNIVRTAILISLLAITAPVVADQTTATFTVEKMNCALCPVAVRKAMERVEGVLEAQVEYDTRTATVTFDDEQTTLEEIANASTEIGYPATPNAR